MNGFIRRATTALVAATIALPIMVAAASPASASVRATGLTWYDRTTGVVSSWLLNGAGTVMGKQDLTWHCDVASGCASQWQPIGIGDLNGDGHADVTWYDRTTGVVSSWLLNGAGTVMGKQDLTWHCDVASGCASQWQPIGLATL
jgi:hypothetical protein